ncbi:ISRSO5-transposase protein [mine drainage metagenome]|uniref:ISRSO5-transposase protein n=1 Tax=mine drainage metagenome TaxID=410659 RepID=T1BRJ1_9ZZZZ
MHVSWLNQIETYFSIMHCKVLTPNDFTDLWDVAELLEHCERCYESIAKPFEWKFTRADLKAQIAGMLIRDA